MRTGTCERCGESFEDRSPAQRKRFCSTNCQKRSFEETVARAVCPRCGGRAGPGSRWRDIEVCATCRSALAEQHRQLIREGYAAGKTAYEIEAETGIPHHTVTSEAYRLRVQGESIPKTTTGGAAHRPRRAAA